MIKYYFSIIVLLVTTRLLSQSTDIESLDQMALPIKPIGDTGNFGDLINLNEFFEGKEIVAILVRYDGYLDNKKSC